jgi:hypothetical protein
MPACYICGTEFDADAKSCPVCGTSVAALSSEELPPIIDLEPVAPPESVARPEPVAGAARLIVYSTDLKPIHTLVLDRDVTRIGRNDPLRGDFVELDVGALFDAETARKVSRKHCVILRSRETSTYVLRPLAGNTSTQVGNGLATELMDYPLGDGTRIVLGGVVRIKFETS